MTIRPFLLKRLRRAQTRVAAARTFAADIRGATAIEYGFIVTLVALVAVVAIVQVANTTNGMWNNVSTKVVNAH